MDEDTVSKKEFKEFSEKVLEFIDQYNIDMRGDMEIGDNGKRGLVQSIREIKERQEKYPSLTYLFAHKPIPTITITISIFLVLYGSLAYGILTMVGSIIGIDTTHISSPTIP